MTPSPWHVRHADILRMLDNLPGDDRYQEPIRHGSMRIGLYAPRGHDPQNPHRQDELYIIAAGSAGFVKNQNRIACQAGDVLFVEAGARHRFEDMSEDFSSWVVFWGPDGGEQP